MANPDSKKQLPRQQRYPVIETIGNVPIRKINYISIMIDERGMRAIARILLKVPTLSAAKIISFSSKPCECCKGKKIILACGNQAVLVPRGLLSTKRDSNGSNITKKKRQ